MPGLVQNDLSSAARHVVERDHLAALDLELVKERLPVAVVHLGGLGQRVAGELFRGGEVRGEERERGHRAETDERDACDGQRERDRGHDREPAANAAPASAPQLAIRSAPEGVVACRSSASDVSMLRAAVRRYPLDSAHAPQ